MERMRTLKSWSRSLVRKCDSIPPKWLTESAVADNNSLQTESLNASGRRSVPRSGVVERATGILPVDWIQKTGKMRGFHSERNRHRGFGDVAAPSPRTYGTNVPAYVFGRRLRREVVAARAGQTGTV